MIQPVNSTTPSAQISKPNSANQNFAAGDFQTFLKMLTTQLTNQDPMNPMESSDFAVQLATFSGVEQQAQTNQLLTQMVTARTKLANMAEWIGKEVATTTPVWFDGAPLTLSVSPDSTADRVQLITKDRNGREIARDEIGPGQGQIDWVGRNAAGDVIDSGQYQFFTESYRGTESLGVQPVSAFARVTEIQAGPRGVELILPGGAVVAPDAVTGLRGGA